jgi:hypothetical protein
MLRDSREQVTLLQAFRERVLGLIEILHTTYQQDDSVHDVAVGTFGCRSIATLSSERGFLRRSSTSHMRRHIFVLRGIAEKGFAVCHYHIVLPMWSTFVKALILPSHRLRDEIHNNVPRVANRFMLLLESFRTVAQIAPKSCWLEAMLC